MRLVLFLTAAFMASPLWSKPILVKSGEHGAFTRLVVYMPKEQEWEIASEQGLTTLSVVDWTEGFDISDAFARIDNERLRSLTASDSNLVMALDCDCQVVAEPQGNGLLSLDISETVKPQFELAETSESMSVALPEPSRPPVVMDNILPVIFPEEPGFADFEEILSQSRSQAETFQRGLGEEIARSSTLAYLEPSGAELSSPNVAKPNQSARTEEELLALLNLRAQFTDAGSQRKKETSEPEYTCPDPRDFAVSEWGGELAFADQLAVLRSALYSEFDKLDQRSVRNLVRFYVHYSLSVEAQSTIDKLATKESLPTLAKLAQVVRGDNEASQFDQKIASCDGETGFWSFIADGKTQGTSSGKVEDLVSTFQLLPVQLKELTADRLISLLEEKGFDVAVGIIKNSMTRDVSFEGTTLNLESELASKSQRELLTLVENNDDFSPQALEMFLRNGIEIGQPADDSIVELTSSYIHQLKGSEIAKRLASLQIVDLAKSKQIARASELFFGSEVGELFEPAQVRGAVAKDALGVGEASEIADFILRLNRRDQLKDLPGDLRFEFAEFFNGHGQPFLAQLSIAGLSEFDGAIETIANIHIQSGQSEDALKLMKQAEIRELGSRASEVLLREDPLAAWEMRDLLNGVASQEAAWVTQNWQDVPSSSTKSEAAELIMQAQVGSENSAKPIQDSQAAFSNSRNARRVLAELLASNVSDN